MRQKPMIDPGNSWRRLIKSLLPSSLTRYYLQSRAPGGTALLTFDDGPYPPTTPAVLKVLERFNIRAIFFVPGIHAVQAPSLLKEMVALGHVVGNHSFSHTRRPARQFAFWRDDLQRCQEAVQAITGAAPVYFRPPFGRLSLPLLSAARHCGLQIVKWSFDVGDSSFMESATPAAMADRWVKGLRYRDIVLLHDKSEKSSALLEIALPRLIEKGFRFDGLDYI